MTGTSKAIAGVLPIVLMGGILGGCGGPTGKEQKLSREIELIKQELAQARDTTEQAQGDIAVLRSKLAAAQEKAVAADADGQQGAPAGEPAVDSVSAQALAELDALRAAAVATEQELEQARVQITALTAARDAATAELAVAGDAAASEPAPVPASEPALAEADPIARQSGLQEQLLAVQADKAALEERTAQLDAQIAQLDGDKHSLSGRVEMLEQSLAQARTRSRTLGEQVAAMQADAEDMEARLVAQAAQMPPSEQAAADGHLQVAKAKLADLEQQLQGALSQNKALRGQVEDMYQQRSDVEMEQAEVTSKAQRSAAEAQVLRARLADVGEDGDAVLAADDAAAEALQRELDYQALLEEGQALLDSCTAGLSRGARQLDELERRSTALKRTLRVQYQAASKRAKRLMLENSELRGMLARVQRAQQAAR